jgi:alkaline phosphatase D
MNGFLRRDFLRAVVAVAGPSVAAGCGDGESTAAQDATRYFPQSVASGDPRPTSVVLWTRVVDPDAAGADLTVELELSTDPAFERRVELGGGPVLSIVALKVRVENLAPGTTYYYRFTYAGAGERHVSRTGRTKTAPDPQSEETVRFAVVSCQDYGGKYFHVLRHAATQPLDFVIHLGDYVYETTNDPSFQDSIPEREVTFSRPEPRARSRTIATSTARSAAIRTCSACTSSSRSSPSGMITSSRTTPTARPRLTRTVARTKRTSSAA